jgi:hypothetical protein
MKPLALLAACAVPLGVLLAGCDGDGSGCNFACDPAEYGEGIDMGDPYEDRQYPDVKDLEYWDQQQREYEENLRQDGYQQGYDEGYQDGEESDRNYDKRDSADSGLKDQWYYNVRPEVLQRGSGPG